MNADRILYRTRQFWQALGATLTSADRDLARAVLSPAQMALFERSQPSEQAHSLRVARSLLDQGEDHPDLLVAALLHDVGKSRFPLNLWQRVLIVLVNFAFPGIAARLGADRLDLSPEVHPLSPISQATSSIFPLSLLHGLRRPFIVADQHAQWGADMAASAGASPLAVALIRRHQETISAVDYQSLNLETHLLLKLQAVDDNS